MKVLEENTTKIATETAKFEAELVGIPCARYLLKSKTANGVRVEVNNLVTQSDINSGCIKGIKIGNKILFNGNSTKYSFEIFTKNNRILVSSEKIAGMTTNIDDIEILRKLRKNKDYFRFTAIIDLNNLNKFWKVYDVQKIEDVGCVRTIKNLLKEQKIDKV